MVGGEAPPGNRSGTDDVHVRTFLIADIRGYTAFMHDHGDEAGARLADRFARIAIPTLEARGGTGIQLRGDEALAVFTSPRDAIRAAVELQARFAEQTVADPSLPLGVGIGLDAGEVVPLEDGYRGGAINLAARLCSMAEAAETLATREVVHLARRVDGVSYIERGSARLKGIAEPVPVIRLSPEGSDPSQDLAYLRALGAVATPPAGALEMRNPYKGLRAFEEADAAFFFGREALTQELVSRAGESRFLAVVGPSGSGKSSVVRAGLVPAIRRGALPGSEHWLVAEMIPGAHPLEELEASLLRIAVNPPASLIEQLEQDERGLLRATKRVLPADDSELVLVIDQLEEVFTLERDEERRVQFLSAVHHAVTDPRSRVHVVTTLRADFYDRPLMYRGFADLLRSYVEALVPLSPDELERAIVGPAKAVDADLEQGLLAEMMRDVADEPGALPLLQYALTELFERREGRTLTREAYREIGGVSGALGRRTEELYGELDQEGQDAARQLFLRLVTLGEGAEDTRRRVLRSEIASLEVDHLAMVTVIDMFGASRQLSFDRDARTGAPTIELAHEAMLTAWPRLHRWIDVARDDVRTERRVAAAASDWIEADRDASFLLAGSRLEQAEAWRTGSSLALTPQEVEFLDASTAERDRRRTDEEARQARERDLERRSVRRLRAGVAVLAVAALVAGGLTVFATTQQGRAEREERTAVARELAAASVANLDVDPERSILLALEAIDRTRSVDGSVLLEAEEALHRAVTASRIVLTAPDAGGTLDWSPEGVFVTEGPEDTGMIDVRDASTGDSVRAWKGHEIDVNDVRFSADGSMLATGGDDGALKVWDPATGTLISSVIGEGPVLGQSFDADGSRVAATWPDEGRVRIVDPATGRIVQVIAGLDAVPTETALSPDGRRVAVGFAFIEVGSVFDVATGDLAFELRGHRYPINSAAWSPDGRWIATGAYDASARIWDGDTGRLEMKLVGHTGDVITVDWASDSRRLVTGGTDGTARVWQVNGTEGREILTLAAQQTRSGTFAAFSADADGSHVLTGDAAISGVKIWDVTLAGDAEVANLRTDYLAPVDVAYLPDGHIVAPTDGGAVSIWDIPPRRLATLGPGVGSPEPVWRIAVSTNGSRIATARNFSSTVTVWDRHTRDEVFEVDVAEEVSDIDWSTDGEHLVVATFGGSFTVFDTEGRRVALLVEGEATIEGIAFSPDGRWIAAAVFPYLKPNQAHVSLWDWEQERIERTIKPIGATRVEFDPSGSKLAVARFDGFVETFTVPDLVRVLRFPAHSGSVDDIAYSPDGTRIATAGKDATVRLFDAQDGTEQLVLRGHDFLVTGVAFGPDGTQLASAAPDGVVRVWELDLDALIRIARDEVTRELSDDECRQYLHLEFCPDGPRAKS